LGPPKIGQIAVALLGQERSPQPSQQEAHLRQSLPQIVISKIEKRFISWLL